MSWVSSKSIINPWEPFQLLEEFLTKYPNGSDELFDQHKALVLKIREICFIEDYSQFEKELQALNINLNESILQAREKLQEEYKILKQKRLKDEREYNEFVSNAKYPEFVAAKMHGFKESKPCWEKYTPSNLEKKIISHYVGGKLSHQQHDYFGNYDQLKSILGYNLSQYQSFSDTPIQTLDDALLVFKNIMSTFLGMADKFALQCDQIITFRGLNFFEDEKNKTLSEEFNSFQSTSTSISTAFCNFGRPSPKNTTILLEYHVKRGAKAIPMQLFTRYPEREVLISPNNKFKIIGKLLDGGWGYATKRLNEQNDSGKQLDSCYQFLEYNYNLYPNPEYATGSRIDYYQIEVS